MAIIFHHRGILMKWALLILLILLILLKTGGIYVRGH
jgi:hypothetical protein